MGRLLLITIVALGCGGAKPTEGGDVARDPECEPGRCLEDIAKAIQPHRSQARACYDAGIAGKPDLPGNRVLINFRIGPDGSVVEASQSVQDNQIEDADVVACIAEVIKGVRFGASSKGKTIRAYHTFEFASRSR